MTDAEELSVARARIADLEELCAAVYQFAGEVGAPPRVLDALWSAAQGQSIPRTELLPVAADECEEVQTLQRQLEAVRRIVAVGPAAAQLGRIGGARSSPAKCRAARANGRKGGRPREAA